MWKRLRDSHREALRRRGQATHNLNPWKYEVLMEFILPQMAPIETREPANSTASQDGCNGHDTTDANTSNDVEPPIVSPESATPATSLEPDKKQKAPILIPVNAKTYQEIREKRREHWQIERGHHRRNLLDSNRDNNMVSLSSDALTNLFTSLCQKTKLLPKFLQLRVQREVFESVTRAEEEAMSLESLNVCYSPTHETSSYGFAGAYQSSPFADASPSSPEVKPQPSLDNCSSPEI